MIKNIGWYFLSLPIWLASCSTLNPVVAQLDQFQQWQAAGQPEKIAAQPVTDKCQSTQQACARLYALHAEALTTISMKKRAEGAVCPASAERINLKSAAEDYTKYFEISATGDRSASVQAEQTLRANYTLTLYCLAESADSVSGGLELAKAVDAEALKLDAPLSLLWRSRAQLYLARPGAGDSSTLCKAAIRSHEFATQGFAANADENSKAIFERLIRDSDQRRRQINACGG